MAVLLFQAAPEMVNGYDPTNAVNIPFPLGMTGSLMAFLIESGFLQDAFYLRAIKGRVMLPH